MHNGFVRVNEEKMSKSLGNFFTVREVLKQYRPEIIRFFILSSHYRSPLNYSAEQLNEAQAALTRLYIALRGTAAPTSTALVTDYLQRFEDAMNDDFNTPVALAILFELARELNTAKTEKHSEKVSNLAFTLTHLAQLLGLLNTDADVFLQGDQQDTNIEQKIQLRKEAKQAKNWILADQLRDELKAMKVMLEDTPDGNTTWRQEH